MALPKFKERRLANRFRLTGLMPGKLTTADESKLLDAKPIDISQHGMGLLMSDYFEDGAELLLTVKNRKIKLSVAWSKPDFGKEDLRRYGLVTLAPEDDMVEIFRDAQCLKTES